MDIQSNGINSTRLAARTRPDGRLEQGLAELLLLNFLVQTLVPTKVPPSPPKKHCIPSRTFRIDDREEQALAFRMVRNNPTAETAELIASNLEGLIGRIIDKHHYDGVLPFPMSEHRAGQELTNQICRALALKLCIPMFELLAAKDGDIVAKTRVSAAGDKVAKSKTVLLVADLTPDRMMVERAAQVLSLLGFRARVISWIGPLDDKYAVFPQR